MDTDDRSLPPDEKPLRFTNHSRDRWQALSEQFASEIDRLRAERDRASDRLRRLFVRYTEVQVTAWIAERERQTTAEELTQARDYIVRTAPALRKARALLASMQASKFWKARNEWFRFKQRLGVNHSGAQPVWLPEVDDTDERWIHELPYRRWMRAHDVRPADLDRMRDILPALAQRPLISIVMPTYETPENYLREAICSVIGQVYPHWELCIADDASKQPHVRRVLEEYADGDPRIKPVFREKNGRISAASNSALSVATGAFVALLDHDDLLEPHALFEVALAVNRQPDVDIIYSDEDKIDDADGRSDPYFKPDWSPDSLLSRNYVSHLGVYRRALVEEIGGFRLGFEGSQDYDLVLRASERTDRIAHIPQILYHWRAHAGSTAGERAQKSYAQTAAVRALSEAIERRGEPGRVEENEQTPGIYTVRYAIRRPGRVSIIIPTRDHGEDVDRCLHSLFSLSTYSDFEVVLLDNGSKTDESLRIFGEWAEREPTRFKVVPYDVPFNFPRLNNFAVSQSSGEYVLLLNNDTEIIVPDWIEAMVEQAQRPSIGAVGAKLLYDDGKVQHAGVVIGLGGVAGHSHKNYPGDAPGYFYTLQTVNNFSAVTAACLMVRRSVFDEVGGMDDALAIAFNDVDFCLRIQRAGYNNIYLPHVVLYHHESKSRGFEDTPAKMERFLEEQRVMVERWQTDVRPDPHYNRNLTREAENYAIGI